MGFCENRRVATDVDVMLNPMGWCPLHIPGAQIRVEFLQQSFYNSRYFLLRGWGSNIDWFSLKLKLDDFTSGFRTTCADMAGGWEEIIAAGSWFGAGAGTGVGAGSRGGVDEVAESTKGAGEVACK